MKLSHIHEDRTPFPFPSADLGTPAKWGSRGRGANIGVGKTLADYLNSFKIYPWTSQFFSLRNPNSSDDPSTELKINDRPINLTKNGPFKIVRNELVEYESIPEPDNPLDNTRDEFGKDFAMFAAVVEGANKFEGQFAWYNEDIISNVQIVLVGVGTMLPHSSRACWEEGKLPKFPRRYKRPNPSGQFGI
jgi:hypothetical protein